MPKKEKEYVTSQELDIYEYSRNYRDRSRLAYQVESEWLASIENGTFHREDIDFSEENFYKMYDIGILAKNDDHKQIEYMLISAIVLASRAAMRGGLDCYEAYNLSDLYMQHVAQAKTLEEMLEIYLSVADDYSSRVRNTKEQQRIRGSIVERVKNYVAHKRNEKFTIEQMANDLHVSRSHLSRQFARQEGITIRQYITRVRLEAAANMLRYSDASLSEISDYLCFHSQSYFGEQFKKQYKLTPLEYRRQNKLEDFEN